MLIKPYMRTGNPDLVFPKADTCFFNLELPNYSSQAILKQKLLTAILTDSDSMDADTREVSKERTGVIAATHFFRQKGRSVFKQPGRSAGSSCSQTT